jgi:hypothetical protein
VTSDRLTTTELISAASSLLEAAGYGRVDPALGDWASSVRMFEDPYCVVAVASLDTCEELLARWPDLQGDVVNALSVHWASVDAKAWDGYLVLLSPSDAPSLQEELERIRYDTTRLRKLVATGDALATIADLERLLRPLLPLGVEEGTAPTESALDLLPSVLGEKDIAEDVTAALIDAFINQQSLMDTLHSKRGEN